MNIATEQGKTLKDAQGDVFRGLGCGACKWHDIFAKVLKVTDFKPAKPASALEEYVESLLCYADERHREVLERSTAFPSSTPPCKLPPPNDEMIKKQIEAKRNIISNKTQGAQKMGIDRTTNFGKYMLNKLHKHLQSIIYVRLVKGMGPTWFPLFGEGGIARIDGVALEGVLALTKTWQSVSPCRVFVSDTNLHDTNLPNTNTTRIIIRVWPMKHGHDTAQIRNYQAAVAPKINGNQINL
ncbi:hypothetical protein LXL04_030069 [Taraxacum kok-saghyz]